MKRDFFQKRFGALIGSQENQAHISSDSENKQNDDNTQETIGKSYASTACCVGDQDTSSEPKSAVMKMRSRFPKPKPNVKSCVRRLGTGALKVNEEKSVHVQSDRKHNAQKQDEVRIITPSKCTDKLQDDCVISGNEGCTNQVQELSFRPDFSKDKNNEERVHLECDNENKQKDDKTPRIIGKNYASTTCCVGDQNIASEPKPAVMKMRSHFPKPKPNVKSCERRLDSTALKVNEETGVCIQSGSKCNAQKQDEVGTITPSKCTDKLQHDCVILSGNEGCANQIQGLSFRPDFLKDKSSEERVNLEHDNGNKQKDDKTPGIVGKNYASTTCCVRDQNIASEPKSAVMKMRSRFPKPKPNVKSCERRLDSTALKVNEEKGVHIQNNSRNNAQNQEEVGQIARRKCADKIDSVDDCVILSRNEECSDRVQELSFSPDFSKDKNSEEKVHLECDKEQSEKNADEAEIVASNNSSDTVDFVEKHEVTSGTRSQIDLAPHSSLTRIEPRFPKSNLRRFDRKLCTATSIDNEGSKIHTQSDKECVKMKGDQADLVTSNTSTATVSEEGEKPAGFTKRADPLPKPGILKIRPRLPKPKPNLEKCSRKLSTSTSKNYEQKQVHIQDDRPNSSGKESISKSYNRNKGVRCLEKNDSDSTVSSAKRKADGSKSSVALQGKHSKQPRSAPNQDSMTMHDLIYWNPADNPMKAPLDDRMEEHIQNGNTLDDRDENDVDCSAEKVSETQDGSEVEEDDICMPGPRVTIGPNGEITLDESSLVIQRTASKEKLSTVTVVEDGNTTYSSFRSKHSNLGWNEKETKKFYQALSTVGTDFTLMSELFGNRSRRELKLKYKREEKFNRLLVDQALDSAPIYNLEVFRSDGVENSISSDQNETAKKSRKRTKRQKDVINVDLGSDVQELPPKKRKRIRATRRAYLLSSSDEERLVSNPPCAAKKVTDTNNCTDCSQNNSAMKKGCVNNKKKVGPVNDSNASAVVKNKNIVCDDDLEVVSDHDGHNQNKLLTAAKQQPTPADVDGTAGNKNKEKDNLEIVFEDGTKKTQIHSSRTSALKSDIPSLSCFPEYKNSVPKCLITSSKPLGKAPKLCLDNSQNEPDCALLSSSPESLCNEKTGNLVASPVEKQHSHPPNGKELSAVVISQSASSPEVNKFVFLSRQDSNKQVFCSKSELLQCSEVLDFS